MLRVRVVSDRRTCKCKVDVVQLCGAELASGMCTEAE